MPNGHASPLSRHSGAAAFLIAALVLGALALASCQAEDGLEGSAGSPGGNTFADVSSAFSSAGCIGCHGIGKTPDLTNCSGLLTGSAVTTTGTYIVPNDTTNSVVYEVVTGVVTPLSGINMQFSNPSHTSTLAAWINAGASCS